MIDRVRAWFWFLAFFGFIIATLDAAFEASSFLRARGYLTTTVRLLFALVGGAFLYVLVIGAGVRSARTWLRASPALALFLYTAFHLRTHPGEQLHFIEYGLLYVLALRAAALDARPWLAYLIAFAATSLAGWCDELMQGRSAVRRFDADDVRGNMIAAALAALVCALLFGRDLMRLRFPGLRVDAVLDDKGAAHAARSEHA